jgi:uncharacterized UPF0160 family protein
MKQTIEKITSVLVLIGIGLVLGLALAKFKQMDTPLTLIATHNGTPHADDIFAVAIILLVHPQSDVIRTRDKELLQTADIRVDVGMKYAPPTDFDHHMPDFTLARPDGRPYASVGLVGKHFWPEFVGDEKIFNRIDDKLLSSIDAVDCGTDTYTPHTPYRVYDLQSFIAGFISPSASFVGKSQNEIDAILYKQFMEAVEQAQGILTREIEKARYWVADQDLVMRAIETSRQNDPRLLILKRHAMWGETVARYPEILFVVFFDESANNWVIQSVPESGDRFASKKLLPVDWAGKEGPEFARITGLPDAVFCHRARFQARAKTKESVLEMADRVLD